MKLTKHTLAALAALTAALILQTPAQADATKKARPAAGAPAGPARERLQDALKDLDLTGEQKEKLRPIFQEQMEKGRALRGDTNLSQAEKMEQWKALREESAPKIKAILTPEQFEKWQKQQNETRERVQDRRDEWGKDLGLTDEQKEKLKPIFQEQMEKMRILRQDQNLSPQEKQEKFKALRAAADPKVKAILTPEQYEKFKKKQEQLRENMREQIGQRRQERKQP